MINQIIVDKIIRATEFTPFAAWVKEKRITTPPKCIYAMTSSQRNDVISPHKSNKSKIHSGPYIHNQLQCFYTGKKNEMPPQRRKCLPGKVRKCVNAVWVDWPFKCLLSVTPHVSKPSVTQRQSSVCERHLKSADEKPVNGHERDGGGSAVCGGVFTSCV